jgi:hypothetical protein
VGLSLRRPLLLIGVCVLAGCDLPTSLPVFEPRFVVEGARTTLPVEQLLPAGVSRFTRAGEQFALSLDGATLSRTLGQLCGTLCALANGATVPKPAFNAEVSFTANLPSDIRSAMVCCGTVFGSVTLMFSHNFGFDPIRPGGATTGSLTITVSSGTNTVGSRTIDGTAQALPPNAPTTISVPITPNATITNPLTLRINLNSPAGAPVRIDTNQSFTITAPSQLVTLNAVTIDVNNRLVTLQQVTLDLNVDQTVRDHTKEGSLILDVRNDFNVSGTLTVSFSGTGVSIRDQNIAVTPGVSTQRIALTRAELLQLMERPVTLSITGRVNGPAAGLTLTPSQGLTVIGKLDLVLATSVGAQAR